MRITLMVLVLAGIMTGCHPVGSHGDDDLRGVPVTNNPHIIPQSGQSSMNLMPY